MYWLTHETKFRQGLRPVWPDHRLLQMLHVIDTACDRPEYKEQLSAYIY